MQQLRPGLELASGHGRADVLPALRSQACKVQAGGDNGTSGRADRASVVAAA